MLTGDIDVLGALLRGVRPEIGRILERALEGHPPTVDEGTTLLGVTGLDLHALALTADAVRKQRVGDTITFVTTRNIQFTNICYTGCSFCAFAHHADDPLAYRLDADEVARRAVEAHILGATEVCMQGGLHPEMHLDDYVALVRAIKAAVPSMHVHAYSPFEIQFMMKRGGHDAEYVLRALQEAGLGSIPGTAAEILDTDVRRVLTKNKLSANAWTDIVKTAHRVGLFSSATIMYGHVDSPRHQAAHIALIRDIQRETGGFTEFVPLGFIHDNTALYATGAARPGPTGIEDLRLHAVARLMLAGFIDHIQVSWVKLGPKMAQLVLCAGADDFGGTLMNETISKSAGATHGESMPVDGFVRLIRDLGRKPARRATDYRLLETWDRGDMVTSG